MSRAALDRLRAEIAHHGSAVVAFSGGVDSSVVLAVAVEQLGAQALGVTSISPSVAPDEAAEARRIAAHLGVELRFVETRELADEAYVANAPDRCFHCKRGLYEVCRRVADERALGAILNGTNADDPADWRPGLQAAALAGVHSPLLACGLGKSTVRAIATQLGLPNWDRPATACLASRLPYGTPVTAERLAAVAAVEGHLLTLGFRQVRARHLGRTVSLEVEPERTAELLSLAGEPALLGAAHAAGFTDVHVQVEGYRSGRMNDALAKGAVPGGTR
jgi:uncharacterized protein